MSNKSSNEQNNSSKKKTTNTNNVKKPANITQVPTQKKGSVVKIKKK